MAQEVQVQRVTGVHLPIQQQSIVSTPSRYLMYRHTIALHLELLKNGLCSGNTVGGLTYFIKILMLRKFPPQSLTMIIIISIVTLHCMRCLQRHRLPCHRHFQTRIWCIQPTLMRDSGITLSTLKSEGLVFCRWFNGLW